MAYKTPGVFVEEITTLAPSVVAVDTAIPAFIGYTQKAADGSTNLSFVPTRIQSLLEYQNLFGGDFVPASYQVVLNATLDASLPQKVVQPVSVGVVTPRDGAGNTRHYYLSPSVRHYFANGGGPCYIVSVGGYDAAPALGDITTPAGLLGGLSRVEPVDEPTLLLFPDGVSLTAAELGSLQVAALAQCEKLQDRFVIMDLRNGDQLASITLDPVAEFRQNVGTNSLKYGAAYYPFVSTIYQPAVHFRQLSLVDTASAPLASTTIDILSGDTTLDALVPAVRNADALAGTVVSAVNVTGMAGPNAITLNRANFARLPDHFASLLGRLRATDSAATDAQVREAFSNLVILPRAIALGLRTLELSAATLPASLSLAITALTGDANLVQAITGLVAYEKNAGVMEGVSAARAVADVITDYASLNGSPWILPNPDVTAIGANTEPFTVAGNLRATALNAAAALRPFFDGPAAAMLSLFAAADFLANDADTQLFARHPVFGNVLNSISQAMVLLPPSGGVAGVYAAVDRARGVWKAPANVSLADISGPAVKINDQMQEDLNVTTTGKSVNAIRAFTGMGSLVWGARTLAGNDNEWRYVPVRRFFNMAEESIRKATESFIFEPNDAGTWVRVRAMIENFLTVQWRQGALAGAVTQQAFFVKVGLGETMTAQDILEGRMIVEVGMAVVRPAEFIILRFAHKMQTS